MLDFCEDYARIMLDLCKDYARIMLDIGPIMLELCLTELNYAIMAALIGG